MVQVKSGQGRATDEERKTLVEWGKAYRARVEIWKYKKGKRLEREIVYKPEATSTSHYEVADDFI
jgi:hypothetical protein